MARVTGVGELDWAMYGRSSDGDQSSFHTMRPIDLDEIEPKWIYELQFYLVPDRQIALQPGTSEQIELVAGEEHVFVIDDETGHSDYDLKPIFLDTDIVKLFMRCNKSLECLRCKTKLVIPNRVSIWFAFTTDQLVEYPDRFLHSLARKMSKWAKEVQ